MSKSSRPGLLRSWLTNTPYLPGALFLQLITARTRQRAQNKLKSRSFWALAVWHSCPCQMPLTLGSAFGSRPAASTEPAIVQAHDVLTTQISVEAYSLAYDDQPQPSVIAAGPWDGPHP